MDENTIHSLLIDLELAGNGQPEGTSYAEELYETQILPAIDQTISQIGATNDLTIEDTMVIDLGEVEASDIAPLLSEQLSREIKRRIHPSAQTDSKPHKGPQSLPTRDDGAFAHFMDFLSNETVPWQYEVETFDAPEYLSKSLSDILRNENLCQQLLDSARNDKRVLWRLLSMASPTTLIRLHDAILPLGTTLTAHTAHNGETPKHGEVNHPQRGTLSKGDVSPSDKETLNHPAHQHIYSLLSQLAALMEQYGIASSESLDTLLERVREEQTKHTSPSNTHQGEKAESEADTARPSADGKSATEDATSTKRTSLPEQLAALMEQYGIASSESLNTLLERVREEQTKHTSPSNTHQGDKAESEADTARPSAGGKSATEDATSTKRTSLPEQLAALMEQYGIASSESLDTLLERGREEQTKHTSPSGIRQGDKAESEADTARPSAGGKSATEDATSTKRTSLPEQLAALMEQYGIASSESLNTLFERVKGEYATQIISAFGRGESKAKRAGMPSAPEKSGGTVQELLLSIERQSIAERQARPFPRRIHIDDAGLVLLHPFLTAYFTQLQLIDKEKQFKTIEDQKRAVHLLKHLSGDEAAHYSHRLALEKMMCGLPPDFPMEHEFQITEEERQESEAMIASLCQYWRPLNGTSMAGLQHSFLLRHGTIEQSDDAWIVRVEGNAMDILLEDLPWEISTIVFPWMEPMILVEWQHN
ncbi:MAG: hypothetical protein IKX43_11440 [Paludibacteraceae bacterium]|nr:hypothetical protein [Paludibacteraceae bacterium]